MLHHPLLFTATVTPFLRFQYIAREREWENEEMNRDRLKAGDVHCCSHGDFYNLVE